jgi:hypothetical protein
VKFSETEQRRELLKWLDKHMQTYGTPRERGNTSARAGATLTLGGISIQLDVIKIVGDDPENIPSFVIYDYGFFIAASQLAFA